MFAKFGTDGQGKRDNYSKGKAAVESTGKKPQTNSSLYSTFTENFISSRHTREISEISISGSNTRCDLSQVITGKLLIYVFQQQ